MKIKLMHIWESIRTSLWLYPALMTLLAILLSFALLELEGRVGLDKESGKALLFSGGPDGARSILSTIAASMITVAGLTLSITVVVLTLTASQFGPRLLRNFLQKRSNQIAMGCFVGTFIYCLIILGAIDEPHQGQLPILSINFAIVLSILDLGVLVYFIHNVTVVIQANHVIEDVHHELINGLQRLFPHDIGEEAEEADLKRPQLDYLKSRNYRSQDITAGRSGYIQAVSGERLLELASANQLLLELPHRPGDYVYAGGVLAKVRYAEALEKNVAAHIGGCFILGAKPTPEQDAKFSIRQLVEIALRALSPGINDPYTAIACVARLGSALSFLAGRSFPEAQRYDEKGRLCIVTRPETFEHFTNLSFDQIRQYGRSNSAVLISMLQALEQVLAQTSEAGRRQALIRQADMISRVGSQYLPEEEDRLAVQKHYQLLLEPESRAV